MKLFIKNMVCNRCKLAVQNLLDENKFQYSLIQLGEVELNEQPTEKQSAALKTGLQKIGFELLGDSKQKIIEKIKTLIIESVHYGKGDDRYKLSEVLSSKLRKDYSYLSHLFSEVEGTTIEKYFINQKIEKAKELLVYNEESLTGIAYSLGYKNVAHLSAQFKQVTGLTPSHFKNLGAKQRKTIDEVK